jgi:hypothetical protein
VTDRSVIVEITERLKDAVKFYRLMSGLLWKWEVAKEVKCMPVFKFLHIHMNV